MPRKRKLKLLVDANLLDPFILNSLASQKKHISFITEASQKEDKQIMIEANKKDRHVLTANLKDFKKHFKNSTLKIGVIGVMSKVRNDTFVNKIIPFLKNTGHNGIYNKFIVLSNTGYRIYYRNNKTKQSKKW